MASRPELTTADYVSARVERARYDTTGMGQVMEMKARYEAENAAFVHEQTTVKISKLDVAWWAVKNSFTLIKIVSLIRKVFAMQNWKTTITSALGVVVLVAKLFGVVISPEITDSILTVSLFAVGFFAKDSEPKQPSESK